jgi:hypothetical protein
MSTRSGAGGKLAEINGLAPMRLMEKMVHADGEKALMLDASSVNANYPWCARNASFDIEVIACSCLRLRLDLSRPVG